MASKRIPAYDPETGKRNLPYSDEWDSFQIRFTSQQEQARWQADAQQEAQRQEQARAIAAHPDQYLPDGSVDMDKAKARRRAWANAFSGGSKL